jgi:hypothetical protein
MRRLGALDIAENQTAQETASVGEVMDGVYDEMKELGDIDWDLTSIPTRYQDPFINVVGSRIAADFGLDSADIQSRGIDSMRRIYSMTTRRVDPRTSPAVDY